MDVFSLTTAALITIIPFYLALLTSVSSWLRNHPQGAASLALGAALFLFLDPIKDTNGLGAYSSALGLDQLVLIAAFVVTFLILGFGKGQGEAWPFWIVATGIAIHAFSESSEIVESVPVYLSNISVALPSAASYVLHKFLEGFVLVAYCVVSGADRLRQVAVAGLPLVILSILGSAASLLPSIDLAPFLASGAAGWMLVVVALSLQLERSRPYTIALIALGFVIVYGLGLLHSFEIG